MTVMTESNDETVQITSLAEVTPDNSSRFGLPTPTNRSSKNSYISESSSDGTSNDGPDSKVSLADDESLDMEQVTGREDSVKAARLRTIVVILFITLCAVVPIALYVTTRKSEADGFEASFNRLATKVIDNVELQLARKLSALDSLRIAITSHVISTNGRWPYVNIPDYDLRANSARELGDMLSLSFHPLVTQKTRDVWEGFTMDNLDWLWQAQAQARQTQSTSSRTLKDTPIDEKFPTNSSNSTSNNGVFKEIYMLDPSRGRIVDNSHGPYLPTSQIMPPIASAINYNALSNSSSSEASQLVLSGDDSAVLSGIENLNKSYGPESAKFISDYYTSLLQDYLSDPEAQYEGDPMSTMHLPIFDEFNRETRKLVGMLSTSISFKYFFTNLLGTKSNGIVCVIENGCGDVVSFEIQGDDAIFLGRNDMHDPSFDYFEHSYNFSSVRESKLFSYREKSAQLNGNYCPYTMRVYPTSELQDEYMTSRPVIYAVTMALAILFMAVVSLSYDYIVQRRMRKVLKTAKESRAIVNSLFPTNVRQRLLKEEEERAQQRSTDQRSADGSSNPGGRIFPRRLSMDIGSVASTINTRRNSNETGITDMLQQPINTAVNIGVGAVTSMAALPAKLRLKFFLNESRHGHEANYRIESKSAEENDEEFEKPIADLFPNCTVLFADIAGFTAWSSEREPEQVFTLLQTIFKTFDTMARRKDIFKVETIGDCYVAVTGLPDPQPDHAIRMTRFARTCIQKVSQITAQLESKLGPGTGQLRMRFGLHSGPVTAGVLRGEKSRFQLFGDTVNTASRMESTGMKNRIQLSPSTAQLLIEAGKENWMQPRKDLVHAKGKGAIQTYWALTSRRTSSSQEMQADERPKFVKSTLSTGSSDNNDDDGSSDSGNASVWGDEDLGGSMSLIDLSQTGIQSQYDSLIDWLVELMTRHLKQIIAGRSVESTTMRLDFSQDLVNPRHMPLDEVTESISLPKFDPKAAKLRASKSTFDVPNEVVIELRQYVRLIAAKYRDNPFHNFAHCGHVTMSASKLLSRIVQPETVNYHRSSVKAIASDLHDYTYGITSDSLTQFAVLLCCVVHDVDHTGVSNAQRGKECPDLALKYKDRSVAEQNSVDIAWALLMEPQFENLRNCIFATESELKRFRQLTVNLVLATDIFDREMKETRNMRWDRVFHSDWTKSVKNYGELRSLKAMIVIEHIIQAADVSHTMQHWHVYKKWNQRLFEEMYLAYLDGRSPKDPSEGWYSGELWFFDNYVIPLAKKLEECKVFGVNSFECLNYALENRKEWELKGKEVVKGMLEKCKKSGKTAMNSSAVLANQEDEIVFELGTPVANEKLSLNPATVSPILADTSPSLKTSNENGLHTIDSIFPKFSPNLESDYESESSSTESTSEPPLDSSPAEIESDYVDNLCEEITVDLEFSC